MTLLRLPILILKLLAWALVILAPTLGVWVASSLAAYLNGPIWLVCLAGLLLFPVIPLAWDACATRRFTRKMAARKEAGKETRERYVTFGDRMILRTFFLNIGFLAVLLATFPQAGFTALASRGDWFLEHSAPETAEAVRPALFSTAEGLAWLYELSMDNPYEEYKSEEPLPTPTADEFGSVEKRDVPVPTEEPDPTPPDPKPEPTVEDADGDESPVEIVRINEDDPTKVEPITPRPSGEAPSWPMKATLHPVVANMPASVETDYGEVARYIKAREDDPFLRVKALNDYVTKRLAYDYPMLRSGERTSQEAKAVFDRKTAVCAGYAKLLAAMGQITGDEIVYVVGVSRDNGGEISGAGHAWNAAKIEDKWFLIDPTWNDGDFETAQDQYSTNYLFTPPAVFGRDHLPDDPAWQLRSDPLSRGDFVRQPILPPEFFAKQLELVSPQRSQFEATQREAVVKLNNPKGYKVLAHTVKAGSSKEERCEVKGVRSVQIVCKVGPGTHQLKIFAGAKSLTWFPFVGQFEVTSR